MTERVECWICGTEVETAEAELVWRHRPDGSTEQVWLCFICADVELEEEE